MLTRADVLANAARVTNIGVGDDQMSRLIFFMLGSRMLKIGEFVERQLPIALGVADQMPFATAVGW